uniref:Acid-sensing ion channel 1-like n=1 Tax=Parastrongyloides trichosuri TaxID=131310 RepID=A0A0N4ZJG8_PARTI
MPEIEFIENNADDLLGTCKCHDSKYKKLETNDDAICHCFNQSDKYPSWMFEVHGLSQALLSKSLRRRVIFWIVLFCGVSLCVIMTTLVIVEYLNGQTATSTTIKIASSMQLPAVTICPKTGDAFNFSGLYDELTNVYPNISIPESKNIILYFLAGQGFENMDEITKFNRSYLDYLDIQYKNWSRNYTTEEFFLYITNKYGMKCEEFFYECSFYGKNVDCCKDIFRPRVVMKRGLCFQSRPGLNQTEVDDLGKLTIHIKKPPTATNLDGDKQKQIVAFVTDNFDYVTTSQKFYLSEDTFNRLYITARKIELIKHENDCSDKIQGVNSLCIVKQWLLTNVIALQNCTLGYLKDIPGMEKYSICNVSTIVNFYSDIIQYMRPISLDSEKCIPGCHRWEYTLTLQQGNTLKKFDNYSFSLDVTYFSLQYQKITEVYTTSIPAFMSQIGGQFGFCLGFSIITIIQIFFYLQEQILIIFFGVDNAKKLKEFFKRILIFEKHKIPDSTHKKNNVVISYLTR